MNRRNNKLCILVIVTALVLCSAITSHSQVTGEPAVDIKANGSDSLVTVSPTTSVSIKISLNPGSRLAQNADWWVLAYTPFGWYSYTPSTGWKPGVRPYTQAPLSNVSSKEVLKGTLSKGNYTFYFAVDNNMDGRANGTWLDYVNVKVQDAVTPPPPPAQDPGGSLLSQEQELMNLINQERQKYNLSPLNVVSSLVTAARRHSNDMAQNNFMSHTGSDGSSPSQRIRDAGYAMRASGENVAAGYTTPQQVLNGWMNSPGHRANILSGNFCDMGVGYAYNAQSNYRHYWTLDLGCR